MLNNKGAYIIVVLILYSYNRALNRWSGLINYSSQEINKAVIMQLESFMPPQSSGIMHNYLYLKQNKGKYNIIENLFSSEPFS